MLQNLNDDIDEPAWNINNAGWIFITDKLPDTLISESQRFYFFLGSVFGDRDLTTNFAVDLHDNIYCVFN